MIDAAILFENVTENGDAVVDTIVEIRGSRTQVKYEIAALLDCLWDIDDGTTFCDAMHVHIEKLMSQKA